MGEKEPLENTDATHGICKDCADRLKKKYNMTVVQALDFAGTAEEFITKIAHP